MAETLLKTKKKIIKITFGHKYIIYKLFHQYNNN